MLLTRVSAAETLSLNSSVFTVALSIASSAKSHSFLWSDTALSDLSN